MKIYVKPFLYKICCVLSLAAFLPLQAGAGRARPLRVVCTIPDLASIAAAVGGDSVNVSSIASSNEDPHFLQARPAYAVLARRADLWVRAGMELEIGWEPILLENARNPRILPGSPGFFDASGFLKIVLEVPEGRVTRAMGDVHQSGNPHYLLDPLNARSVAIALAEKMKELRPEFSGAFEAGLNTFVAELDRKMFGEAALEKACSSCLWKKLQEETLDSWLAGNEIEPDGWYGKTAAFRGSRIVTFHKSFVYLANRFGFIVETHLEPVPGVPPGPAHLKRLVDIIRENNISIILMEPFYPKKPAEFVASETGARVVVVSSYAPGIGPDDYFEMMDTIIDRLCL